MTDRHRLIARIGALAAAGAIALSAILATASAGVLAAAKPPPPPPVCALGDHGAIRHVIYLQFDNTHFRRDVPNVPSDLEQMPHLLNFLTGNGTLLTNDHTILISHTAGGILSSLTGLYPDRQGMTVSNSYDYYQSNGVPTFASSFKYWTDTVDGANDSLPNMVGDGGQTTPAPWVTYTAAGCNVGGVSAANIELENNNAIVVSSGATDPSGDMTRVFGESSPEWNEGKASQLAASGTAARAIAQTDFVGIAIHCAVGNALCTTHGRPDDTTTVPGSNHGATGLFGAKYVNPAIGGSGPGNGCVKATDGTSITDPFGQCGFPGFDGALARNTLGEVAQMQENGVPVTYAYISDAHDNHVTGQAFGPGEAGYKAQLADYDAAFKTFFTRLAADGITKSNTLFVVTVDEGDHVAAGPGTSDGTGNLTYSHGPCTLATTACPANQIGEVTTNLKALLPAGEPTFDLHFDDAPTIYVNGQPSRTDPTVRKLEQDVATTTAIDPYAGGASVPIAQRLADTVEMKKIHMINNDPKRTPTFTLFGNPDFFFQASNSATCGGSQALCVDSKFAWNHGDFQEEIGNTWVGFVGPGIHKGGVVSNVWTDHVDVRPTINAVLHLSDRYVDDGRVITQILNGPALPTGLRSGKVQKLGDIYKQLNAPFGAFALDTLVASTTALSSTDALQYDSIESQIATLTLNRDVLAGTIRQALNDGASGANKIDDHAADGWITQAQHLLKQAHGLAGF